MKAKSISPHSVKHIPQRTCLACRKVRAKEELIRLVCGSDKGVEVDLSGKKAGRGAYLCPTQECWAIGLRGGQLEHSLKVTFTRDNRERLVSFGQDLFKEGVSD